MDIVQRLRKDATALESGPYTSIKETREAMRAAADEIERLRGAADTMAQHYDILHSGVSRALVKMAPRFMGLKFNPPPPPYSEAVSAFLGKAES